MDNDISSFKPINYTKLGPENNLKAFHDTSSRSKQLVLGEFLDRFVKFDRVVDKKQFEKLNQGMFAKLNPLNRNFVWINLKDENNKDIYVRVNKNSLSTQFNISKKEMNHWLKANESRDVTELVKGQMNKIIETANSASKKKGKALVHQELADHYHDKGKECAYKNPLQAAKYFDMAIKNWQEALKIEDSSLNKENRQADLELIRDISYQAGYLLAKNKHPEEAYEHFQFSAKNGSQLAREALEKYEKATDKDLWSSML